MAATNLIAENHELRARLQGFDRSITAFSAGCAAVFAELKTFHDECAADPAMAEGVEAAIRAADRMAAALAKISAELLTKERPEGWMQ